MLLAELEVRHTRLVQPTRRIALGETFLPADPPPGPGGILLGAIVGAFVTALDEEARDDLDLLIDDLERHRPIAQPRLRFRFQTDVVGLDRSRHRLLRVGRAIGLEVDDHGAALPQVLGAVYAASLLSQRSRPTALRLVRRAAAWQSDDLDALIHHLSSEDAATRRWRRTGDAGWALGVLGFRTTAGMPERAEVIRRFRELVRDAHPDVGGEVAEAGDRITDLTEAKRILLLAGP